MTGTLRPGVTSSFRRILHFRLPHALGSCERNDRNIRVMLMASSHDYASVLAAVTEARDACREEFATVSEVATARDPQPTLPTLWHYVPREDSPNIRIALPLRGVPLFSLPREGTASSPGSHPSEAQRGNERAHIVSTRLDAEKVKQVYELFNEQQGGELDAWRAAGGPRVSMPYGVHKLFDTGVTFYFAWMFRTIDSGSQEGTVLVSLHPRLMPGTEAEKHTILHEQGFLEVSVPPPEQVSWTRALALRKWVTLAHYGPVDRELLNSDSAATASRCWSV